MGRDSSVGIATHYGLDSPGIESPLGLDLLHPSRLALGPTLPPVQWVPGFFPGLKRPGREVSHSPQSSVEIKEWICVSPPSVCLHEVDKDSFICTII